MRGVQKRVPDMKPPEAEARLISLLVASWELKGAPPGDEHVLEFARLTVRFLIAESPKRAVAKMRELLKPSDFRDPGGVKETYRELTSKEYRGVQSRERPPSLRGSAKNRSRADALYPQRWDAEDARMTIQHFHEAKQNAIIRARTTIGARDGATTREGRELERATKNWIATDDKLLRESLAGNERSGLTTWHQVELVVAAWREFTPDWLRGELGRMIAEKKKVIKAARPKRGKTVRVNGEVKWRKRAGRPRTPMPRGPYRPRNPLQTPPANRLN